MLPQDAPLQRAAAASPDFIRKRTFDNMEKKLKLAPIEEVIVNEQMVKAGLELKKTFDKIPNKEIKAQYEKNYPKTMELFDIINIKDGVFKKDKLK